MADFDNGLPPANTDMTGKCVSNVSINTDDAESSSNQSVQAVKILTDDVTIQAQQTIQSVSVGIKQAGKNRVMYM